MIWRPMAWGPVEMPHHGDSARGVGGTEINGLYTNRKGGARFSEGPRLFGTDRASSPIDWGRLRHHQANNSGVWPRKQLSIPLSCGGAGGGFGSNFDSTISGGAFWPFLALGSKRPKNHLKIGPPTVISPTLSVPGPEQFSVLHKSVIFRIEKGVCFLCQFWLPFFGRVFCNFFGRFFGRVTRSFF